MPLPANMRYTIEVDELYSSMLANCKKLAADGYKWNRFKEWPSHYSRETCKTVLDRFQSELFIVHDYHAPDPSAEQEAADDTQYTEYSHIVDWADSCTMKCDAQTVQLCHPGMRTEAIEYEAQLLYSKVLGLCNTSAVDGDYSYLLNLTYMMCIEVDSGMSPSIGVPATQRLLVLLKEEGFNAQELHRDHSNFIDISWMVAV